MPILPYNQEGVRKEMENLMRKLEIFADELPQFAVPLLKLKNLHAEIVTLSNDQNTYRYNKQQTSQRLKAALKEGRSLLNFFWIGLKEHYGTRNEKLVEFGLQPFRGRARKRTDEEPTLEKGKEGKKTAAQAVAPEAEPPKATDSES